MLKFKLLPRCAGLMEGERCNEPAAAVIREDGDREYLCDVHFALWLEDYRPKSMPTSEKVAR